MKKQQKWQSVRHKEKQRLDRYGIALIVVSLLGYAFIVSCQIAGTWAGKLTLVQARHLSQHTQPTLEQQIAEIENKFGK